MPARTLLVVLILLIAPGVAGAQATGVLLKKNLDAAQASLKKGDHKGALLSVKAALAISPHNQRARAIEMDVYVKKGDALRAMDAALKAADGTKSGDKSSPKTTKRILKYIKQKSPALAEFLKNRTKFVDSVLKLRKTALKDGLASDAEWLVGAARSVYPTHPRLEEVAGPGIPRIHEINIEPGLTDLLKSQDDWVLYNVDKSCGIKDGVFSVKGDSNDRLSDIGYKKSLLAEDFVVTCKVKYSRLPGGVDPNIYVIFSDKELVEDGILIDALAIDPFGRNRIGFLHVNKRVDRRWKIVGASDLPKGTVPAGEWVSLRIEWDSAERTLSLDINSQRLMDQTLPKDKTLGRYLRFGCGTAIQFELKEVYATMDDDE